MTASAVDERELTPIPTEVLWNESDWNPDGVAAARRFQRRHEVYLPWPPMPDIDEAARLIKEHVLS